uniref:Uncharacterized protein n=1 Tax=Heliothis virescens TaxID=7102 RepID=A0A2A4J961_HELVI
MKLLLIILVIIATSECGLIDDLVPSKEKAQSLTGLLNNKPRKENDGVVMKVRETLENGTKIVIDALGNIIKINPKDGEENSEIDQGTIGNNEVIETAAAPQAITNTTTEKNNDIKLNQNETTSKVEDKTPENKNETSKTDGKENIKDTGILNATEPSVDEGKVNNNMNCTAADVKPCNVTLTTRTSLSGDACPPGKERADDNTCVDVV